MKFRRLAAALLLCVVLLLAGEARPTQALRLLGCTAWGVQQGGIRIGSPTCEWEVTEDSGFNGSGPISLWIYREGRLKIISTNHPCGAGPALDHENPSVLRAGDLVVATAHAGWVTVGPLAGAAC